MRSGGAAAASVAGSSASSANKDLVIIAAVAVPSIASRRLLVYALAAGWGSRQGPGHEIA